MRIARVCTRSSRRWTIRDRKGLLGQVGLLEIDHLAVVSDLNGHPGLGRKARSAVAHPSGKEPTRTRRRATAGDDGPACGSAPQGRRILTCNWVNGREPGVDRTLSSNVPYRATWAQPDRLRKRSDSATLRAGGKVRPASAAWPDTLQPSAFGIRTIAAA